MFCPSCGSNVPEGSGFCPVCGTQVTQQAPAAPVQPEIVTQIMPEAKKEKDFGSLILIIMAAVSTFCLMLNMTRWMFTWFSFLAAGALLAFMIIRNFRKYDSLFMAIPISLFTMRYLVMDMCAMGRIMNIHYTFLSVVAQLLMIGATVLYWLMATGALKNKKLFSLIIFCVMVVLFWHFSNNAQTSFLKGGLYYARTMISFGIGTIMFFATYIVLFVTDKDWLNDELAWIKSWFKKKPAPVSAPARPAAPVAPAARTFCPYCGKEQETGSLFCSGCGNKLPQ